MRRNVGGGSPITIRHGCTVIYVKEVADLEAVLTAVKGSSVQTTLGIGDESTTLAGDIIQLGITAQSIISGLVGAHCPSLRDGLFKLKKSMKVGAPLAKKLMQLNSTSSLLRHYSEQWGKDLLHELQGMAQAEGKLGGELEVDTLSCQSVGSTGTLDFSDDAEADPAPAVLYDKAISSAVVAARDSEIATEVLGPLCDGDAAAGKGVGDLACALKPFGESENENRAPVVALFDLFDDDDARCDAAVQTSVDYDVEHVSPCSFPDMAEPANCAIVDFDYLWLATIMPLIAQQLQALASAVADTAVQQRSVTLRPRWADLETHSVACEKCEAEEALELFNEMQQTCMAPRVDPYTALRACEKSDDTERAVVLPLELDSIHAPALEQGKGKGKGKGKGIACTAVRIAYVPPPPPPNIPEPKQGTGKGIACTAVRTACVPPSLLLSPAGVFWAPLFEQAIDLDAELQQQGLELNGFSCATFISACERGRVEKAFGMFAGLHQTGWSPDEITYIALCSTHEKGYWGEKTIEWSTYCALLRACAKDCFQEMWSILAYVLMYPA